VRLAQDAQEVEPALAVGTLEVGEQFVADVQTGAGLPLVPRPRIVHADVRRRLQAGGQQLLLLLVEGVPALGQEVVELADRDVQSQLPQLLQQQRLGDPLVVVLMQDVASSRPLLTCLVHPRRFS